MVEDGEKLPRKIKKALLGPKMSTSKLRKRLSRVKVFRINANEREATDIFCPHCGCNHHRTVDHPEIEQPEIWIEEFCLRCGKYVGGADNSFYSHVLFDLIPETEKPGN